MAAGEGLTVAGAVLGTASERTCSFSRKYDPGWGWSLVAVLWAFFGLFV